MADERIAGGKAVDLHRAYPPIDFLSHTVGAAGFGRTAGTGISFHANNVFVVERVEGFVPLLFPN